MDPQKQATFPENELSALSEQQLLDEEKKLRSFSITNAFLVGFMGGVILYSIARNTWGLLTLIPLYFIYRLVNDPKNRRSAAITKELRRRGLK